MKEQKIPYKIYLSEEEMPRYCPRMILLSSSDSVSRLTIMPSAFRAAVKSPLFKGRRIVSAWSIRLRRAMQTYSHMPAMTVPNHTFSFPPHQVKA